jgi:hypothetical protein
MDVLIGPVARCLLGMVADVLFGKRGEEYVSRTNGPAA